MTCNGSNSFTLAVLLKVDGKDVPSVPRGGLLYIGPGLERSGVIVGRHGNDYRSLCCIFSEFEEAMEG